MCWSGNFMLHTQVHIRFGFHEITWFLSRLPSTIRIILDFCCCCGGCCMRCKVYVFIIIYCLFVCFLPLNYDGRQPSSVILRTDIHDDSFFDNFLFFELLLVVLILICDGDVVRLAAESGIHREKDTIAVTKLHWNLCKLRDNCFKSN